MQTNPLTTAQKEILDAGLLTSGFNCVLQLPTGGGKTWLAEYAIEATLQTGLRAIYITPLRALADELLPRWRTRFPDARVGVFTGDYTSDNYPVPFRDAHVLIMTPERLDACTRVWRSHWSWIPQVDLIVADEIHLLGDMRRGPRWEGALLRMQRLNPFLRVLGLSATLGNRRELATWLNGVEYVSRERPVPLTWRTVRYRKADEKPALLEAEVWRTQDTGGQTLVFVQSRRRAEGLAAHLCAAGLPALHHHGGLSRPERLRIEERFRSRAVPVLIATPTLEMGINLPVRQVVLYDLQEFDGVDFAPLPVNAVWQRVGRAGRRGLDDYGEAVLLAPQWDRSVEGYASGSFEPIRSGLRDERALTEQILSEVASGLARRPAQLDAVFRRSLATHQGTLPDVPAVVARMREAGLLTERIEDADGTGREPRRVLAPTRLGRVATRHFLSPSSLLLVRRLLDDEPHATYLDLLITLCATPDCEPLLPADYEELEEMGARLADEPSRLLQRPHPALTECLGAGGRRLLAVLKTALATRTWTRTGDATETAERFGAYPFEVERLSESLHRLALAIEAMYAGDEEPATPLRDRLRALTVMVRSGVDEEAVTLTLVPGIGPTTARRLVYAGVTDVEALALTDLATLREAVPRLRPGRADRWIEAATALVQEGVSAYRFRDADSDPNPLVPRTHSPVDLATGINLYRLRRARELKVAASEGGLYRVVGGTDPHLVQRLAGGAYRCDCADAAKGMVHCKHVLAIRLRRGDAPVVELVERLENTDGAAGLDLYRLWHQGQGTWEKF